MRSCSGIDRRKPAGEAAIVPQLREHLAGHAILATNTSTIPVRRIAEKLPEASRFCGMHFFHPVRQRPLVEVVRGADTGDRAIASVVSHAWNIGRMPIVVEDGPGFVVNRLLFPYLGEALELLREGVSAESIERAAAEFGMALGPLRLIDEIGLDTTLHAGWVLGSAFPERIASSPLLVSMVKAGRLGQRPERVFLPTESPQQRLLRGQSHFRRTKIGTVPHVTHFRQTKIKTVPHVIEKPARPIP